MAAKLFVTPAGERLVVMSEEDYEDLIDSRDGLAVMLAIREGRMETFSSEEVDAYLAAPRVKLRFWRERRGLSREALADASGIAADQIARIEAGELLPDQTELARLGEVLRTDADGLWPTRELAEREVVAAE